MPHACQSVCHLFNYCGVRLKEACIQIHTVDFFRLNGPVNSEVMLSESVTPVHCSLASMLNVNLFL